MSILDMDVPGGRRAGYIRSREFATIRKGYDQDQVRQFLEQVAGWFDDLETDVAEARAAAAAQERADAVQVPPTPAETPAGDPYAAVGSHVAEVLRHAEEHAQNIRQEAEQEAQRTLDEARRESISVRARAQEAADEIRQSAQQQADAARREAQEEADRVRGDAAGALETARVEAERSVAGLSERRNALTAELQATRTRLLSIVSQLEEDQGTLPEPDPAQTSIPSWAEGLSPTIPVDDPRRDPIPPDLPAFSPPPLPERPSTESGGADEGSGQPEGTPGHPEGTTGHPEGTEVFEPPEMSSESASDIVARLVEGIPRFQDDPALSPDAFTDLNEELSGTSLHIEPDEHFSSPGELPHWGRSDAGESSPDISLPDFPSIDIPMLDDEGRFD
jgi:DivIVA domain-containing protein